MSDAGGGWQRVKDVFQEALARPVEARDGYLDSVCATDPHLRHEVESLLAAHHEAKDFLSRPGALVESALTEGRRIGPYRVLGLLGRGGMGVVYRCVRDDDVFQKTVALKVVGSARRDQLLRFHQERQILARLQHPNIAAILDGGATDEGQPYMVMELVAGQPIHAWCAARGLGRRERLELFRTVCSAVHYAHQNLVVHRDLKPQNILVTDEGEPKLLDFGIAKLVAAGEGPDEAPTATLLPLMTPEYASPEQVCGGPVTTATDVYSLGVVLFELLTGSRPYAVATRSLAEMVRVVRDTEPPLPSAAATLRGGELRGDLDTIVLKALRKEPARRYLSAQELAEDVRRHLAGLPVLARRDTVRYRLEKFVRRHRIAVGASALLALSLVGGLLATVRQARIADAHRRLAERRFDEVRGLAGYVMTDLDEAMSKLPGSTPLRKQLVEKTLAYLDGLAGEASTDSALQAEIAHGYERLGQVQGQRGWANLADGPGALRSIRKAIVLRELVAARSPGDAESAARLAEAYGAAHNMLRQQGEHSESDAMLAKMKRTLDALPSTSLDETRVLVAWQVYYDSAATLRQRAGDLEAARDERARQVEVAEKLAAREPDDPDARRNLALACKYYGGALHRLGERQPARVQYDRSLELDRKSLAAEPTNPNAKLDLSFSLASIGSLLRDEKDLEGALRAYRSARELRQQVFGADPDNEFAFSSLVRAHQSIAGVLAREARLDDAVAEEREVLRLRAAWEENHPSPYGEAAREAALRSSIGDHHVTVASIPRTSRSEQRTHWQQARAEYARALATWTALARDEPLEGESAAISRQLEAAIARCDRALAGPPR
jgi:non-specific serine/threonine protein kinase/serine/threonine-protein kinase